MRKWSVCFYITLFILCCYSIASAEQVVDPDLNRNNFDLASLLSLFGIGFLKFIDEIIRIKLTRKFKKYRICLGIATAIFAFLEAAMIYCYCRKIGSISFGNIKNIILGLIPIVFCILTLVTAKDESETVVLEQSDLEQKINEFTSCNSSPLDIIVGDMDFLGKVYNNEKSRNLNKKDNIVNSSQLKSLIDNNIDTINIICKIPKHQEAKRRIGYLLYTFDRKLKIRFFNESIHVPKIRGRIMYKENSERIIITRKIKKKEAYEFREYGIDTIPGALFSDLWHTVWNCNEEDSQLLNECLTEYRRYVGSRE